MPAAQPTRLSRWRNGAAVDWDAFHGRVAAWSGLLGETAGDAFALVHHDAIEFAAALFGAWLARKTVFLPGDNLPGTCAGLRANVAGFLGEFDAAVAAQSGAAMESGS